MTATEGHCRCTFAVAVHDRLFGQEDWVITTHDISKGLAELWKWSQDMILKVSNLVLKISLTLDACHFSSIGGAEILKSDQQNCCGDVLLLFRPHYSRTSMKYFTCWNHFADLQKYGGWTGQDISRHYVLCFFALVGEVVHCVWRICDSKSLSLQIYTHTLPKQAGQRTAPCCYVRSEGLLDSVATGILHMFEHSKIHITMRLKCFSSTFINRILVRDWNLQFEEKPMLKVRAVSFVGLPFLWLSLASARDLPLQCWAFLGFVASKWIAARSRCLFPGMAFSRSKKNDRSLGKKRFETTANIYLAVWFKVP